MVPVEWPIAAAPEEGGRNPARATGRGRMPAVRTDFFLDSSSRLTEQERSLMTAMLTDLVAALADELNALLGDVRPANDDSDRLFDRLWRAGLLDIADLVSLLLRRAEEERLSSGIRAGRSVTRPRFLQSLVSDDDAEVSAAAMALILARGRRRDRFDGPRLAFDDLPADVAVVLVNAIAAALREELRHKMDRAVDEQFAAAAQSLVATHDEGNRLEVRLFELVHALDRCGRVDEGLLHAALADGEVALLAEALARRASISFGSAWGLFTGPAGDLALLLRMAGVSRDFAGELLAGAADVLRCDAEKEIRAFDELTDEKAAAERNWLRLDADYRGAVDQLSAGDGQRSV